MISQLEEIDANYFVKVTASFIRLRMGQVRVLLNKVAATNKNESNRLSNSLFTKVELHLLNSGANCYSLARFEKKANLF